HRRGGAAHHRAAELHLHGVRRLAGLGIQVLLGRPAALGAASWREGRHRHRPGPRQRAGRSALGPVGFSKLFSTTLPLTKRRVIAASRPLHTEVVPEMPSTSRLVDSSGAPSTAATSCSLIPSWIFP